MDRRIILGASVSLVDMKFCCRVYNAVDYRSAGDPKDGANSGHFTLHVPVGQSGPSSVGDLHLGEHNPYTTVPGFLDHAQEVIKHHLDH